MRKCPKCGREFASKDRVCPDDGSLLQDTVSLEEQAIGRTLDGKYRIDGFLTRGGMGSVYRGTHVLLNKPIAIKLIRPELVTSHDMVERFFREARAAAKLSHPYIVTVHDLGQAEDGTLYIIMELVEGRSLKEIIQTGGPWEPSRAIRFVRAVASALSLAHRNGIVHRDLKPQNIMVYRDSEGNECPKLLDFGIAKTLEPDSPALTSTGMVLGTPHYMSAEQAKGQPADQRSDIYALGVILYEMLVGKVPFDDKSIPSILVKHLTEPPRPPSSLKGGIAPEVEKLVLRCLEKDPERRFQTADELTKSLTAISETMPLRSLEPTVATVPPHEAATLGATAPATMAGGASAAAPAPAPIPFPPPPPAVVEDTKRMDSGTVRAREVKGPVAPPPPMKYETPSRGPLIAVLVLLFLLVGVAGAFLMYRNLGTEASTTPSTQEASLAPSAAQGAAETGTTEPESASPPAAAAGGGGTGTETGAAAPIASPPSEIESEPEPAKEAPKPPPEVKPTASRSTKSPASTPALSERAPSPSPSPSSPPPVAQPARRVESAPPAEASIPENPGVSVDCQGLKDACAVLRVALREQLERRGMAAVPPARADILVDIETEEIEARTEEQFGNTFVIRTYSVSLDAQAPRFGDSVSLPPRTFSFDARLGREKLRAEAYVTASDAANRIANYWESKRPR